MNTFCETDIVNWIDANHLNSAARFFEEGLRLLDSNNQNMADGELQLELSCSDPEQWIGAALAALCRAATVWFVDPGVTFSQRSLLYAVLPKRLVLGNDGWRWVNQPGEFRSEIRASLAGKLLIATGGSSGRTRFAIHDKENLLAAVDGVTRYFAKTRSVKSQEFNYCCDLPVWHVSGWMQVMRAFRSDGRYFVGKDARNDWMSLVGGRYLSVVPTQLKRMLADRDGLLVLNTADVIVVGGGACPIGLLETCLAKGIHPWVSYGMTETLGMIAGKQITGKDRFAIAADVFPHADILVVDPMEPGQMVSSGIRGEIIVRSKALCEGYFPIAESERCKIIRISNELKTRDWGSLDEHGRLHVWGRMDDLIVTGGEKVNPMEVVAVVERHPLVSEAYVAGIADEDWGEQVVCLFVSKDGAEIDTETLKSFSKQHLEGYKVPKSWARLECLPFDEKGKLQQLTMKALLRETFAKP